MSGFPSTIRQKKILSLNKVQFTICYSDDQCLLYKPLSWWDKLELKHNGAGHWIVIYPVECIHPLNNWGKMFNYILQ